ncbi:precorrin-3B C(17)-methyltransferase [Calothrix rhizosoleniae]|uniref:precorrin-3B C(17)-methyltransferase n=1 Tax=Calothrix rhizosoleniae TaxID=888997 RepID=UPI000B49892C|nr:precorrin-3B C(17)-methyltransferase [Calothrix rhizosoleniae]
MLLTEFSPLAAIATTPAAIKILQGLDINDVSIWVPELLSGMQGTKKYTNSLKNHIADLWQTHRAFVFCLATGAVVRLIAPLLQDKSTDPTVVVVDESGKFVISLCSGHQGGGDELARLIATQIGGATPVITGSANSLSLPGVDILGIPFGWRRGEGNWTGVSAAIARGENIGVIQVAGSTLWRNRLPERHPFDFAESSHDQGQIFITPYVATSSPTIPTVNWHPRVLWVGIGCERGSSRELIETAIREVFKEYGLAEDAIAGIATIDIKADEVGLVEFCQSRNLPFKTFTADVLKTITVPNPSSVVEREVGTPSVAEAAALCAGLEMLDTRDGFPKDNCKEEGQLLVPKQIFRFPMPNSQGAVTVAVAQGEKEYIGRHGQILLVGMGPGKLSQMTPAAQIAVTAADAVIGYGLYIDLIAPLLRPGQIVEALPITQERQRAQRGIELAEWGLNVAVISSGDCGIYGMAGLVLEELQSCGWDGKVPNIEVFPGITALQAAAARVGTPLMHDFCAISLSDLLTPWEVIKKRLEAAAVGDFVTALYNPRSQTRTQQLGIARDIFLKYRNYNTPVALVRSAYREDEQITLTTLEQLLPESVDMLTTVLIGNQSTRNYGDWMITPRGYLGFGNH